MSFCALNAHLLTQKVTLALQKETNIYSYNSELCVVLNKVCRYSLCKLAR